MTSSAIQVIGPSETEDGEKQMIIQKVQRIGVLYGSNFNSAVLLPNVSMNDKAAPSGVAYHFSANSPAFSTPFDPARFETAGVSVFMVRDVPESSFRASRDIKSAKANLLSAVQASPQQTLSMESRDPSTNTIKQALKFKGVSAPGCEGDTGLYEGWVFNAETNIRSRASFIVVNASLPDVSAALVKKISDKEKAMPSVATSTADSRVHVGHRKMTTTMTMDDLLNSDELRFARQVASRNRAAIAAQVAKKLGVKIATVKDSAAIEGAVGSAFIDMSTNTLVKQDDGSFVYHNDSFDTAGVNGYAAFKHAPGTGYTLMAGRPCSHHPDGSGWFNDHLNAFPAGTGRTMSVSDAYSYEANNRDRPAFALNSPAPDNHRWCWGASADKVSLPHNDKLCPGAFKIRDMSFKQAEARLGREHIWTEVELAPVVVYLDATPAKKVA